jgi:hypothetical protein
MEEQMKISIAIFALVTAAAIGAAVLVYFHSKHRGKAPEPLTEEESFALLKRELGEKPPRFADVALLDKIAETERAKGYVAGIGLYESQQRELAGDFAGSVIAAFKEMLWAHALSDSDSVKSYTMNDVENGLEAIITEFDNKNIEQREPVNVAAEACLAFTQEKFAKCAENLSLIFDDDEEADSFLNWMRLICAMSGDPGGAARALRARYAAMRARYSAIPAYWYYGARYFPPTERPIYAENCVDSNPRGAYAQYCRDMLAEEAGIAKKDAQYFRTRMEIEAAVGAAIKNGDASELGGIIDVLRLNDNSRTLYAAGALKTLAKDPRMRPYLTARYNEAKGRQRERLEYILGNRN